MMHMQAGMVPEAVLTTARAEAAAAAEAARGHAAEVARLRGELDGLNRQLEATCTLRLQPRDASDSQARATVAALHPQERFCRDG